MKLFDLRVSALLLAAMSTAGIAQAEPVAQKQYVEADPNCAIAYWGLGNTLLANAFSPTPTANLPAGLATVKKGQAIGAKSQKENDLLNALAVYYTDYDKFDENFRLKLYGRAMKQVAIKYPADDEVQIAYALALLVAASPYDMQFAGSRKGARKYYGQLLEVAASWDTQRPEIAEAHSYILANP